MLRRNSIYLKLLAFYLVWFLIIALIMIPIGINSRELLHVRLGIHHVFVLWFIVGLTQILSIAGVLLITWHSLRTIRKLVAYCRAIKSDGYPTWSPLEEPRSDEIGELAETLVSTTNLLTAKLQELSNAKEELEENVDMLKAIFEVDQVINSPYVDNSSKTITHAIVNNIKGTALCSIWLFCQEANNIHLSAYSLKEDNLPIETLREVMRKIVRQVFDSEKTVIHDLASDPELNSEENLKGFLVVSLPLKSREGVIGVLNIWQRKTKQAVSFSEKQRQLFSTLATNVAMAIENKTLSLKMLHTQRIEKELEIASSIQTSLYKADAECSNSLFYAKTLPAHEVGGDYYTLMPVEKGKCLLAVADISGKGIPAALMAVNLNSIIRIYGQSYQSPEILLSKINSVMYEDLTRSHIFLTAILAVYDPSSRRLIYANGGHCYPLIYQAQSGKIEELALKGIGVGLAPEANYRLGQQELEKGDIVIFYSDGVLDGVNEAGERFGKKRLANIIEDSAGQDSQQIATNIMSQLKMFMGNQPQKDDITIVVIKVDK